MEKVTGVLISSVIIATVSAENTLHDTANSFLLSFKQQMDVVGHQTESIKKKLGTSLLFDKQCEKLLMIFGRMKNILPVVTHVRSNDKDRLQAQLEVSSPYVRNDTKNIAESQTDTEL
ncbi:MAG: hypothetical protein ABI878_12210 [Acidobacteriota bacterium]